MALLSVIVLGLLAMFHQTQRAFTQSLMQVDVLEAGRAATDLMSHELEQMAPAYVSNGVNFYAVIDPNAVSVKQPLTLPPEARSNVMEQLFFLTRYNQQWKGIGYRLAEPNNPLVPPTNGVGTLYRYDSYYTNDIPTNLWADFVTSSPTNFQRIADGVVHFRVRAYHTNGSILLTNSAFPTYARIYGNIFGAQDQMAVAPRIFPTWEMNYIMVSNSLPASVELELGFLETRTLERFRSMEGSPVVAQNFLSSHSGQVHLFSKRVQIRNVDAAAYR